MGNATLLGSLFIIGVATISPICHLYLIAKSKDRRNAIVTSQVPKTDI